MNTQKDLPATGTGSETPKVDAVMSYLIKAIALFTEGKIYADDLKAWTIAAKRDLAALECELAAVRAERDEAKRQCCYCGKPIIYAVERGEFSDGRIFHGKCREGLESLRADRDRLQAELKEATQQYETDSAQLIRSNQIIEQQRAQIAALTAQLEEGKRDTVRLTWLANECWFPDDHPETGIFMCASKKAIPEGGYGVNSEINGRVIRKAIDAAIAATKEQG